MIGSKNSAMRSIGFAFAALFLFRGLFTVAAYGQDCLEPCECHPLSNGIGVGLSEEAGCAPFAAALVHTMDSTITSGYSFSWEVTGGDFEWAEGTSAASESPSILFLESGVYQIELTAVDTAGEGCSGTSNAAMVPVAGPPEVLITEAPELCAGEEGTVEVLVNPGNTVLSAFAWGANAVWDTLEVPAPLIQSFGASGPNEVVAWASNACGAHADTVAVTVYPTPALTVSSSHSWYCLGSHVDFVAEGEGAFTWSSNSELLQGGQPGDQSARYTVGSQVLGSVFTTVDHGTKQCSASAGFNAYGFFVPSVSISADEIACAGEAVELQANVTSYGWDTSVEWIVDGVPADSAPTPPSSTVYFDWEGDSLPSTHTVEAAIVFDPYPVWLPNYGCTDTVAHTVEVAPLPVVDAPTSWTGCDQLIAEDFPPVEPEGGWWSTTEGIALNEWIPGVFGLGESELIYTYEDGNGCQSSESVLLHVEAPVWALAGADTMLCAGTELVVLNSAQEGGSWSGPGISDANSGVLDLAELAAGPHELVFHLGDGSCATTDTMVWEVLENPTVFISTEGGAACDGDTVWLESFAGGGTVEPNGSYQMLWSSQVEFNAIGLPFVVANAEDPLDAIELVAIDDAGCEDQAIAFVSAVALPDVTAPALTSTCDQDFAVELPTSEGVMDGWSGPGVNEESNAFNPAIVGQGEVDLVYTVSGTLGCTNSDTTAMEVLAVPSVSAGPSLSVCALSAPFELVGYEPVLGTWEGPVQLVDGQTLFNPTASGTGNHLIVYAVGEGSCAVRDSMTVEVMALPILSTSNAPVVCEGDTAAGQVVVEGASDFGAYDFAWAAPAMLDGVNPWELSAGPWNNPGQVTASVVVTDSLGCASTAELLWEVHALPHVVVPSSWSVCANEGSVELPVASPENGLWSGSGVEFGLFDASTGGPGTFSLTYAVVDDEGCANEAEMLTEVVSPIELDLGPKIHACVNQGLAFLPTPAELVGFWEGPGLEVEFSDAVNLQSVESGTHTYVFTHTGEVCTVSADVELEVHTTPEIAVVSGPEVCPDSLMILEVDVEATALPLVMEWAIDGAPILGDSTELGISWPTAGARTVMVSATDDWGCSASIDWTVEVLQVFQANAVQALAVCNQAIPIDLTAHAGISESGVVAFTGLGAVEPSIDENEFLHPELLAPGAYEIQYEFEPVSGCAARDTFALTVGAPYHVQAGPDTAVCASQDQVELLAENGSVAVTWSVVDAPQTPVLDANTGVIDVQSLGVGLHGLAVQAGAGSCATRDTLFLEVLTTPALDFSNTVASACVSAELTLTVDAPGADAVQWTWAEGSVASDSIVFEASDVGTTEFEVSAFNVATGCGSSAPWILSVEAGPEVEIFSDVEAGCSPLQVSFSTEGMAGSSQWNWTVDGMAVGAESTLDFAFETTDTLSASVISVSLVDGDGCVGLASKEIEVWPLPNAAVVSEQNVVCGFPAYVAVSAGANATDQVQWNVNGQWMATGADTSVPLLDTGLHAIEAVLTNAWGCTQVAVDFIEVLALPSAALSAEPMMGCGPLEVLLNVAPGEAEPTLSLLHEGNTSVLSALDSVLVLNQPGAYQLMLHVVDDRGCENTVELADSITVFPTPFVDFEANPYAGTFENPDPLNSTWSFENLSDAGEALWDFGDGTLSTIWNGAHTYDQPGTYAVNVMVVNALGCAGEATLEVEVEENLQVFIPNAFTPPTNGYSDGVNDGWRPEISAPELVDSYWMRVFNRYGQLIWESYDPQEYWIGQAVQESDYFGMNDAYTWVLRVESRAQRPAQREWRGHVTLIR